MRLLDDAHLLFNRVLTARPGTSTKGIRLDALFRGGVHLKPYVDTYDVPTWHIIGTDQPPSYAVITGRLPLTAGISQIYWTL